MVAGTFTTVVTSPLEKAVAIIGYLENYLIERFTVDERVAMAPEEGSHTPGMSVAWRRSIWEETGGQPEWLRAAEDLLFGRRLAKRGVKIALQASSQIHHHMRSSLGQFYSMNRHYARGRGRTGLITPITVREMGVVLTFFALLLGGFISPWLWLGAVALFGVYALHKAVRPLYRAEGLKMSPRDLWNCTCVAMAGTAGTIVGTFQGARDWWTDPSWRKQMRAYLGKTATTEGSA